MKYFSLHRSALLTFSLTLLIVSSSWAAPTEPDDAGGAAMIQMKDAVVSIEGVRFYCDGCIILDAHFCGIPQSGQSLVLPCEKVFDYLLRANSKMKLDLPSSRELMRYVLRENASSERLREILWLLDARQAYSLFSSSELAILLRKEGRLMESLLQEKWGDEAVLKRIWSLLRGNREVDLLGLKALVLARLPNTPVQEVVRELGADDIQKDLAFLSVALTYSQQFETSAKTTLEDLKETLESCQEHQLESLKRCSLSREDALMQAARDFFHTAYVDLVLALLRSEENSFEQKVAVLSEVPYELLSESDNYAMSSIALDTFLTHRAEITVAHLERSRLTDLLALSGHSHEQLFSQVQLLLRSARANSDKQERPQSVVPRPVKAAKESTLSVFPLLFVMLGAFVCFFVYRWRSRLVGEHLFAVADEAVLEDIQRKKEIADVYQFFGLAENAEPEQLRSAYRRMARVHHPDRGEQDAEKFLEVQQYYERAQKLLSNS